MDCEGLLCDRTFWTWKTVISRLHLGRCVLEANRTCTLTVYCVVTCCSIRWFKVETSVLALKTCFYFCIALVERRMLLWGSLGAWKERCGLSFFRRWFHWGQYCLSVTYHDSVCSSEIMSFFKVLYPLTSIFGLSELLLQSLKFYVTLYVVYIQTAISFQLGGKCICLVIGVFPGL